MAFSPALDAQALSISGIGCFCALVNVAVGILTVLSDASTTVTFSRKSDNHS